MFTNNYKKLAKLGMFGINQTSMATVTATTQNYIEITNTQNTKRYSGLNRFCAISTTGTNSANGAGWSVGSGTTEPTADDYNLEQTITSGVTISVVTTDTYNSTTKKYDKYFTITVTATADNISISEIGWKDNVYSAVTAGGTASGSTILMLRDVIPTVTLNTGDVVVFRYDFSYTIEE